MWLTGLLCSPGAVVVDHGDLEFDIVPDDLEQVQGCKYARTVGKANQKVMLIW